MGFNHGPYYDALNEFFFVYQLLSLDWEGAHWTVEDKSYF